jgi:hypothetical protein
MVIRKSRIKAAAAKSGAPRAGRNNESVTALYSAASGNHLAYDRHHALRHVGV